MFFDFLNEHIMPLTLEYTCYVLGDFNVHVNKPDAQQTRFLCQLLDEYNLHQKVNFPTHSAGNILDLIITNEQSNIKNLNWRRTDFSDYFLLTFDIQSIPVKTCDREIKFRKYWKIDQTSFKNDLFDNLCLNSNFEDSNEAAETLLEVFTRTLEVHAPMKKRQNRACHFYDSDLRMLKRERRKYERKFRKDKTEANREAYEKKLRESKNAFREKKCQFYNKILDKDDADKAKYAGFKLLFGDSQNKCYPDTLPEQVLANNFNQFFSSKIKKLTKVQEKEDFLKNFEQAISDMPDRDHSASMFHLFGKVTREEVEAAIKYCSSASSPDDPCKTSFAKEISSSWINYFVNFVNSCFEEGVFPDVFKTSFVLPLIKNSKLNKNSLDSYRPVANLLFFSKVIERLIYLQLLEYLDRESLLDPKQSAYRKYHSTETTLLYSFNSLLSFLDDKKVVILIALDLSAAFDTINHSALKLLMKSKLGINGKALELIISYLTGRRQKVMVNDKVSEELPFDTGVPQGSLLGPLLFSLYLLPISSCIDKTMFSYQIFADDTTLYVPLTELNDTSSIEHDVIKIAEWFEQMGLTLNAGKTKICVLRSGKSLSVLPSFTIKESNIECTRQLISLGITIDEHLSLNDQIRETCRICNFFLRKLYSVKHYLSYENRNLLARCLILSRLDYCNSLYVGLPKFLIEKLQRVLNSACRFVCNVSKFSSITPFLHDLHWLPIQKRIEFKILLFVHRIFYHQNEVPEYFRLMITRRKGTNRNLNLTLPKCRSNFGKRSFSFAGPKLWNALPLRIKQIVSVLHFRKLLKTHLFRSHYY